MKNFLEHFYGRYACVFSSDRIFAMYVVLTSPVYLLSAISSTTIKYYRTFSLLLPPKTYTPTSAAVHNTNNNNDVSIILYSCIGHLLGLADNKC